jgi:hypothetical protein
MGAELLWIADRAHPNQRQPRRVRCRLPANFYPIGGPLGFDDTLPVYSLAPGDIDWARWLKSRLY